MAWALTGPGIHDPLGNLKGTDFVSFWTVSAALQQGHAAAIYHPDRLAQLEDRLTGGGDFFAWAYPPTMLLTVYPLALVPYQWSLAAWLALALALYLRTLWKILPDRLALWAGLAFPAVFVTVTHGQNGLLISGLFGAALSLLPRYPALAGGVIGMLAIKPPLAILIPLALASARFWRAAAVAAVSLAALCGAALLLFGSAIWADFLASLPLTREMLERGLVPYFKFQSAFAAIRLLGGSLAAAYATQAAVTVLVAAFTAWVWRRPVDQNLKNAALAAAAPLATPFVFDYDLTLLAMSAAWLLAAQTRTKALPWEKTVPPRSSSQRWSRGRSRS